MATNVQEIKDFLKQFGWNNYHLDLEKKTFITGCKADNLPHIPIWIVLMEDGEYLRFIVRQLFYVNDNPYKGVFFQTAMCMMRAFKMIQFDYDPTDGEVRVCIEIPLEDSSLTYQQFERILNGLVSMVDNRVYPRLKNVLSTGLDPEMNDH